MDLGKDQPWGGDLIENDDDWLIMWHGVRIRDRETASRIMKTESTDKTYITVNPTHLQWVTEQISKKDHWWVRFRKWLSTLFRFRQ
jgi:hypothetical protein